LIDLYEEWLKAKVDLSDMKSKELELRNQIIESIISNEVDGNIKKVLDGYKITVGVTIRNTIDEPVLDSIYSSLSDEEKNCVKFKPSLVAKDMKLLDGSESLWEAIITKPGQNTLKIDRIE